MSDVKLWACPCCGGETVEATDGFDRARACFAGCAWRHRHPWSCRTWWTEGGAFPQSYVAIAHTECRDLPGPCGTRPDGADVPIVASVPSPAAQVTIAPPCPAVRCVVCGSDACVEADCRNGHAKALRFKDGRVVCCRECSYAVVSSCPRCNGSAPPDATGEPWCVACGAQARYLRAVEPERDPYARMRAEHAARMRSVCLASAHTANVLAWDDYHGKPRFFSLPCIHQQRGRGMTPCVCERAERGRGAT